MKIVYNPVDMPKFKRRGGMTKWLRVFEEFEKSDAKAIELIAYPDEYSSVRAMYTAGYKALRRFGKDGTMRIHKVRDHVYLVKET